VLQTFSGSFIKQTSQQVQPTATGAGSSSDAGGGDTAKNAHLAVKHLQQHLDDVGALLGTPGPQQLTAGKG
jgi:hypothetical protein